MDLGSVLLFFFFQCLLALCSSGAMTKNVSFITKSSIMQVTCTSTTDFSGAGVHEILEGGMEQIERNFFLPFVATYEKV